jgi:hypothetical protein
MQKQATRGFCAAAVSRVGVPACTCVPRANSEAIVRQRHAHAVFPSELFANGIVQAQRTRHPHAKNLMPNACVRGDTAMAARDCCKDEAEWQTCCARRSFATVMLSCIVKWLLFFCRPSQSRTKVWMLIHCSARILSDQIKSSAGNIKARLSKQKGAGKNGGETSPSGNSTTSLSQTKLPPLNTNPAHSWPSQRPCNRGTVWVQCET